MEKIEVSHRTIIFTVALLITLWFLYQIRSIILFLFVCLIFTTALSPIINKLEKRKVPRPLAIIVLYFIFIGIFVGAVASAVPIITKQTSALLNSLPAFLAEISFFKTFQPADYSDQIARLPGNLFKIASSVFSNLVGVSAFLVINFYLLMERKNLEKHLHFLFATGGEKKAEELILALEEKLGGWVRGELFLMFAVGLMSYSGLRLLDVDYALPLALIAGVLELIPNIGPTLAMVPAAIVGFASSSIIGLAVVALYFLIQQLENNFIVPLVMRRALGLHPLITLLALMIGLKIGGVGGTLLAIPVVLFIKVIIEELYPRFHSSPDRSLGDQ